MVDMSTNQVSQASNQGGLAAIVEEHGSLFLAVGAIIVVLVVYNFFKKKVSTTATANTSALSAPDLSGLQTDANGNPIVYVPTSTEFYTDNSVTATSAPDAPATITTSTTNNTTTNTVGIQPPGVPISDAPGGTPVRQPPVVPPVSTVSGTLAWDQTYTVHGGDTLASIASAQTAKVRNQGAPSTLIVTYANIYTHNQTVIDNTARVHGNPIKGGPQNNIFPGEMITVPRWVK